jgi:hypothetical protein
MPKVCLPQCLAKQLDIRLLLLVPCSPDNKDGRVISVGDIPPLLLAHLVNKAKL